MPRRRRVRGGSLAARCVAGGAAIVVGLVGVWLGVQVALAGFGVWQAELFLEDWRAKRVPPSDRSAAVASAAAQQAVDAFPVTHADLQLLQGDVLAWQTWAAPVGDPQRAGVRRAALDAYREAVRSRPEHSSGWIGIARIQRELGEIDSTFELALWQAVETAPWRVSVLRQVARLGVRQWNLLGPRGRYATVVALARTAASDEREARALIPLLGGEAVVDAARSSLPTDRAAILTRTGPAGILARVCFELRQQQLGDGYGLCR